MAEIATNPTLRVPDFDCFAKPTPYPKTDWEVLAECLEVMERIKRDNFLCGAGTVQFNADHKIERPLYGCMARAMDHIKVRLVIKHPIKGGITRGLTK